jgi:hypothetical protein
MKLRILLKHFVVGLLAVFVSHLADPRSANAGFIIRNEYSRPLEFYALFTFGPHIYARGPYLLRSGEQDEVDNGSFSRDRFYAVGMRDPGLPKWAHPNTVQTTHQGHWVIHEQKKLLLPSGSWQLPPNQLVADQIQQVNFRPLDQFVQRNEPYHNIFGISPPMPQTLEFTRSGPLKSVRTRESNHGGELRVDWNGFVQLRSW